MYRLIQILLLLAVFPISSFAQGLRSDKQLASITIFEKTSGLRSFSFKKEDPRLLVRRAGQLTWSNNDFSGVPSREFYDAYYSDADGKANPNGNFVSIEIHFINPHRGGGGNITAVGFSYADGSVKYADYLASFFGNGKNYLVGSEAKAVDGDTDTYTIMGNNYGLERKLRLTVGFMPVYAEASKRPVLTDKPVVKCP